MTSTAPRLARRTAEVPQNHEREWVFPCLRIEQGEGRLVFCFAIDGKMIDRFASIARIGRDPKGELVGYQRPEVMKHIHAIRSYIDSKASFIPNAVVISFMRGVQYRAIDTQSGVGTLTIRLGDDGAKPGFVVDGQQRLAAIRTSARASYPIFANAFIARHQDEQRSQFVLVNNTKPLPKGLIHELLPSIHEELPKNLSAKRTPAAITIALNRSAKSPFRDLIRMPTSPNGIIADTSIQRMVQASLGNGLLRRAQTLDGVDIPKAVALLIDYWDTVKSVFDEAWGRPPAFSRLMHGVGIVAMGSLMDYLAVKKPRGSVRPVLEAMRPACAWTKGTWKLSSGTVAWNALENTPRQMAELARFLTRTADSHL